MKFKPKNRHLLLGEVKVPQEDDKSTILLPEEYKARINPHAVYQVLDFAEDCTTIERNIINKLVVVNDMMADSINVDQGSFMVILENHIIGVLEE